MTNVPALILGLTASLVLTDLTAASGQAREPRLPDAVTAPPAWLKPAPFDIDAFFRIPPPEENAAPLYLDALFEFGDEVAACFPAEQRGRAATAKDRQGRLMALVRAREADPAKVADAAIDALVAEFGDGLAAIARSQRRPRCVFALGITFEATLPHAQVARTVARVLQLKAGRDLARGDLDAAIEAERAALRLARDLRPRGPLIVQLVASAIESVTSRMAADVLGHPALTPAHCDRLLALWADHEAGSPDPWSIGAEAEYVTVRSFVTLFERGTAPVVDDLGHLTDRPMSRRDRAAYFHRLVLDQSDEPTWTVLLVTMGLLARYSPAHFRADHATLDDFAATALAVTDSPYPARRAAIDAFQKRRLIARPGLDPPFLLRLMLPDVSSALKAFANMALTIRATRCRVAVRRWQLTEPTPPADLAAICARAGMPAVPADPYAPTGGPLRLALVSDVPVVYSIGGDGVDDHGTEDDNLGKKPKGDSLFPVSASGRPTPRPGTPAPPTP